MAHGDFTGKNKARLAHEFAEQQQLAARSQTLVSQVVQENRNEVIDLWCDKDDENLVKYERGEGDEVVQVAVEDPQFKPVRFKASEDVEQVTVGQGREFNLKAGHNYQAPLWVVQHLDNQGLVWH